MKKKYIKFRRTAQYFFYCCVIALTTAAHAQQTAQYSLWQLNKYSVMPAYAGLENNLNATLAYRRQWLGLNGSPASLGFNAHTPIDALHGGIGFRLENDQLGAENNIGITATYAYHIKIDNDADNIISLAGGVGILQKSFNGAILKPANQDQTDNIIPATNLQSSTPLFQAGIYYKNKNFNFGGSFTQYSPTRLRYATTAVTNIRLQPTFTLLASNKFPIGENFAIEPALLFKSDPTQMQAEIASFFHYKDNIFIGAAFRGLSYDVPDAATASIGFNLTPSWSLGYGYDIGLSPLRGTHSGTHEIVLIYKYNKRIGAALQPKTMYNTRHY
jgi:type IX secretion system PorP/SprF family membrane protein